MPDFTAVPEALRSAGTTASASVTALHGADCWAPVNQVSGALPGARAAAAATAYVNAWTVYFAGWCARAEQHAAALTAAATSYTATDQQHAAAFTAVGGSAGDPPGSAAGPGGAHAPGSGGAHAPGSGGGSTPGSGGAPAPEPGAFAPGAIVKALG